MKQVLRLSSCLLGVVLVLGSTLAHAADEYLSFKLGAGEDLSAFSLRLYGTTKRWREIAELNKDTAPNPNALVPGTELKVRVNKQLRDRIASGQAAGGKPAEVPAAAATSAVVVEPALEATPGVALSTPSPVKISADQKVITETIPEAAPAPVPAEGFRQVDLGYAERQAAKNVVRENRPVRVSLTNGHWGLSYGLSSTSGSLGYVNFNVEAGFRWFESLPNLSTDFRFNYYSVGSSSRGYSILALGNWHFSEDFGGFSTGLGVGYDSRLSGGTEKGITIYPTAGYDLMITDVLSVGLELGWDYTFSTPTAVNSVFIWVPFKLWR